MATEFLCFRLTIVLKTEQFCSTNTTVFINFLLYYDPNKNFKIEIVNWFLPYIQKFSFIILIPFKVYYKY